MVKTFSTFLLCTWNRCHMWRADCISSFGFPFHCNVRNVFLVVFRFSVRFFCSTSYTILPGFVLYSAIAQLYDKVELKAPYSYCSRTANAYCTGKSNKRAVHSAHICRPYSRIALFDMEFGFVSTYMNLLYYFPSAAPALAAK